MNQVQNNNQNKNNKSLTFYGGVGTATGANILLTYSDKKIMVDCGFLQGGKEDELKNFEKFVYDPSTIDFLLITHAHMDHIGKVPKLVKEGFKGKIISTAETKDLAKPMLEDALKVMKMRHPEKLLYENKDIEKALSLWQGYAYHESIELAGDIKVEMQNAGHILGSAIINVSCGKEEEITKISFTGDLGNSPSPLLPDTEIPINSDYIIMESVYGDRNHENKEERREKLKSAIKNGIERSGNIIIPTFSIERTQVILYELNNMIEDQEIQKVPVYLDSPLAIKVTDIYKKHLDNFKKEVQEEIKKGDNIFDFPGLNIVSSFEESQSLDKKPGPKIILAGSGMSLGGRIVDHEAENLGDPKNTIILVGYQSVGSLGRAIQNKQNEVVIHNKKINIKATIENIQGYSSHKDSEHLLEFIEKSAYGEKVSEGDGGSVESKPKLKQVFCIMGEPHSSLFLSQRIRDYLDIEAIYPEMGKEYLI